MTATILFAEALLAASIMMSICMRFSLTGSHKDWTINMSAPRTLSR